MTTVYLIAPGTRVSVSEDGVEYRDAKLKPQLQFDKPVEITDTHCVFADGRWRIRVDRAEVIVSRYDGQGGTNQFGV